MTIMVLAVAVAMAQAPEKFTYQAVVRNASNALVTDAQVSVRVSILQGSASGNAVYVETHTATTNTNGLLTIEIGGGSNPQGTFVDIDWANGPSFMIPRVSIWNMYLKTRKTSFLRFSLLIIYRSYMTVWAMTEKEINACVFWFSKRNPKGRTKP